MADKLGIYIHIPFCRSKCDYCDFYSLAGRDDRMDQYQKALLSHIKETAPLAQDFPVDTIYIGGGTPSYYGAKRLKELLGVIPPAGQRSGHCRPEGWLYQPVPGPHLRSARPDHGQLEGHRGARPVSYSSAPVLLWIKGGGGHPPGRPGGSGRDTAR